MTGQTDVLQAMYEELRATLPPLPALISDADRRSAWLAHLAQVVGAMQSPEQQWAALVQISNDLVTTRYPGLPMALAYAWLAQQCGLEHVLRIVQAQHLKDAREEEEQR